MDGPLHGSASDIFFINSIIFICKGLKMNSYLIELEEDLNFSWKEENCQELKVTSKYSSLMLFYFQNQDNI